MPDQNTQAGIQQELMNRLQSQDPKLKAAWQVVAKEQPEQASAATIRPMNWFERVLFLDRPEMAAMTHPWNTVVYRPELVGQVGGPEDLFRHELTHVRQNQKRGGGWTNLWNLITGDHTADEQEAFAAEKQFANRRDLNPPTKR